MEILNYITPIVFLLSCLALLWLTYRAFKRHIAWGFAVLLLSPISATVFGVSHWRNEKFPFLAYITTFIAAIALCLYLFTAWGGWEIMRISYQAAQGNTSQQAAAMSMLGFIQANLSVTDHTNQNQNKALPELLPELLPGVQPEFQEGETTASDDITGEEETGLANLNKKITPKTERYRLVYKPIQVSDAKNYVGATMKVTRKNVKEKEYRLVSATPNSMEFSQRNKHGSFSLNFKNREIEKIRVLTREPY